MGHIKVPDPKSLRKLHSTALLVSSLAALFSCALCPQAVFADETPLVTGNGFGFAVYSQQSKSISRFYAHPYKFEKADPKNLLSEGIETQSFVRTLNWRIEPHPGMLVPSSGGNRSSLESLQDNSEKKESAKAHQSHSMYLDQSHIIQASDDEKIQSFFMPFGLNQNVLISTCSLSAMPKAPAATTTTLKFTLHSEWVHKVLNSSVVRVDGITILALRFEGMKETLLLVPLGKIDESQIKTTFQNASKVSIDLSGAESWAFLSLETSADIKSSVTKLKQWQSAKPVEHELAELNKWRVAPAAKFKSEGERKLWRQSETVLRMAQIKETDNASRHNHGLILASLPDGAWFVPWVRDMAYATFALIGMGHKDEAKAAIAAYLNARPVGQMQRAVGNLPYQVSVVRYFGDGSEEPFFTM
ncbi:MAG: hypothetical protein K2X81_00795, partial [Candidatus Obscuribacterales bacterium]|nr:hypothetical protein [Candidatus Obscuribacterales bacterium]